MIYTIISLLLLASPILGCSQDWECGNPAYFNCAQPSCTIFNCPQEAPCVLLPGVGISPNRVYWLQRCPSSGPYNSTVYLMRAGTNIEQVAEVFEYLTPYSPTHTFAMGLISANFRAVYVRKQNRVGSFVTGFSAYYQSYTEEFFAATQTMGTPPTIDIAFNDGVSPASYVCFEHSIVRYNTLNFTAVDEYSTLYSTTGCNYISLTSDALYWANTDSTTGITKFYKGDLNCANCTVAPQPFASLPSVINDFEIVNDRLYFARPNGGIESIAISSPDFTATLKLVASGDVSGFKIRGDRLWFNDGTAIKGINLDQSDLRNTYVPLVVPSTCQCEKGFSGVNCTECPNGMVQWKSGIPSCVRIDPILGFPESCSEDWHCGNVPFTRCKSSVCECVIGNTALTPSCDSCVDGSQITWNNGIPSCPQ